MQHKKEYDLDSRDDAFEEMEREDIAIIGMAARYPGARDLDQLWRNLRAGVESVRRFSDEELLAAGHSPEDLADPQLVKMGAPLEDIDLFDAQFFRYSPREAESIDPQQRLFLQCAWHALEHAGYDSLRFPGRVGVFASTGLNTYVLELLARGLGGSLLTALRISNEKDYIATRTSFALNLRGPSIGVQSACSSSLVATHLARESLLGGESDMALVGGVNVQARQSMAYRVGAESMVSNDGHCRPFDAEASGSLFTNGLGVVVLRRLEDALADGDTVHAVLRGTAVNNDGALKVGFTAPGVQGQTEVIRDALDEADVDPSTVSYVEAHGTATTLGDPIEVRALSQAFGEAVPRETCALGSVKSNFGHTETAAGVAGLIKTTLALSHRELPPSLNFEAPNAQIDFTTTPFYVNAALCPWESRPGVPRRAGVSSFGVGGTNAHAVLEEAPPRSPSGPSRPWQLLTLSARSQDALKAASARLAEDLAVQPAGHFADAAHTLRAGRREMEFRRAVVAQSPEEAIAALGATPEELPRAEARTSVVFLFPGQGAQRLGMAAELYRQEATFRTEVDRCCELLGNPLGPVVRDLLVNDSDAEHTEERAARLEATEHAQPALFIVEYALAQLWRSWGVIPQRMIGHSIGEWVAACLAGVFSLKDALELVALRGRLLQALPAGDMLAVLLAEERLRPFLDDDLSIAAVNGAERTVAAGPPEAIAALAKRLEAEGIGSRPLSTSHAFHSTMVESAVEPFIAEVARRPRKAPKTPWVSNLTGAEISDGEAMDPRYWGRHLREPVRFDRGLGSILREDGAAVLVEVGPGDGLLRLARRHPARRAEHRLAASCRRSRKGGATHSDQASLLTALGQLWTAGISFDALAFVRGEDRRRIPLPLYPFEERRYWVEGEGVALGSGVPARPARRELQDWFHRPVWRRAAEAPPRSAAGHWLLIAGATDLATNLARALRGEGARVTVTEAAGAVQRFEELTAAGDPPQRIVHMANVHGVVDRAGIDEAGTDQAGTDEAGAVDSLLETAFYDFLTFLQTLADKGSVGALELVVLADGLERVQEGDSITPAKAALFGPARVAPVEIPHLSLRVVDGGEMEMRALVEELTSAADEPLIALRAGGRWEQGFEPVSLAAADREDLPFREKGIYLITGGFGGLGFAFAEHLACNHRARLALLSRSHPDAAKVRRLEEAGAEVLALRVDVTDVPGLMSAVKEVRDRWGGLHGVVHAAGAPGGGLLALKTRQAAEAVLAAKVQGTLALHSALGEEALDFLVLCSSTLGTVGTVGQVDYCAANAVLDAFADAAPPQHHAVSIAWDLWPGVGMAAGEGTAKGTIDRGRPLHHPLLTHCLEESDDKRVYTTVLAPPLPWVAEEHRLVDVPSLPGTALVEIARAAAVDLGGFSSGQGEEHPTVEIRDFLLLTPVMLRGAAGRELRVTLERRGEVWEMAIASRSPAGGAEVEHARGKVVATVPSPCPPRDLEALRARCGESVDIPEGPLAGSTEFVSWGPRWSCLEEVLRGGEEALATLALAPDFRADLEQFELHPALLDVATSFGIVFFDQGRRLPLSYDSLVLRRPLPGRFLSHVRLRPPTAGAETSTFDVALLDAETGDELVTIEGFLVKDVPAGARAEAQALRAAGEEPVRGIQTAEGLEAFERILAHGGLPRVVVATEDFPPPRPVARPASVPAESAPTSSVAPRSLHPRPELASEYAAPRDKDEERIAAVWQEVLGVEQVGIHDSFFDLGGDSLLLSQVRTRMQEVMGIDIPITRLFEHPTIAGIAESLPTESSASDDPREASRRERTLPERSAEEGGSDETSTIAESRPAGSLASDGPREASRRKRTLSERSAGEGGSEFGGFLREASLGPSDAEALPATAPFVPRREDIAIIGMSGRFPGARNLDELWRNLAAGVESITFFSDEELLAEGVPAVALGQPNFVKALPLLEGATEFDNAFFGIPAYEAEGMDPQHRIFLESSWEALEHAGYAPRSGEKVIGMFAGRGIGRYFLNLVSNPEIMSNLGTLPMVLGNDKDYLPTRVSFKLDLRGPSVNVQAACSTSLLAVHMACRSLLEGDCEMALAGGVAMVGPEPGGYVTDGGGMMSPDGHCRAFDAGARGTIFGSGSGVVVLKRLAEALSDGDTVHAVIKGSAMNNDGGLKMGFSAPGVDGQRRVVLRALESAGVEAETVNYIEAHGTATQLGDPIEVAALNEVFRGLPPASRPLGSIKSNIGHGDAAAGIAGLIKTVLSLKHHQIPPSLHFEEPNPEIDFAAGPFYVNTTLANWPRGETPRRAGVSAFGIGGTNAHVIVEEAPEQEPTGPSRSWQTLHLSARTDTALDALSTRLADHLEQHPEIDLADVAYTLEVGRQAFSHRRVLTCREVGGAVRALREGNAEGVQGPFSGNHEGEARGVVFLFPGQGAQYIDMGRELYASEEVFRSEVDKCAEILEAHLGLDLRELLFPTFGADDDPDEASEVAAGRLRETRYTQPALFTVEWALAQQWQSWGLQPHQMLGHSVGEFVAACLAGVFSLEDALALVAARGRLMQSMEPGAMLSVPLTEEQLEPLLTEVSPEGALSLAAINAPRRLVVAGTFAAVAALEETLARQGTTSRRLVTSHAFHSAMMDPLLDAFRAELEAVSLQAPRRPFISGVTGRPIRDAEAQSVEYWLRQLRRPVRYSDALEAACAGGEPVLLEVGPGRTLGSLAKQIPATKGRPVVYSMRHPREWASDQAMLLAARGRLWIAGCALDAGALRRDERRRRIPLPTYPFERQNFYVEMGDFFNAGGGDARREDLADWFYIPTWKPSDLVADGPTEKQYSPCLVFVDGVAGEEENGLGDALVPRLREHLSTVITVRMGSHFTGEGQNYTVDPGRREDFAALLRELRASGQWPKSLIFGWGVSPPLAVTEGPETPEIRAERETQLERGLYSLFHLGQLIEEIGAGDPLRLLVLSSELHRVRGGERIDPEKAALVGGYMVIPQEYRNVFCHGIDVEYRSDWAQQEELLEALLEELSNERPELAIAYRDGQRYVESYEPVPLAARKARRPALRRHGCYLITGGLGGLGLTFARHLAEEASARLVLTGRSGLPARETWPQYLEGEESERGGQDAGTRRRIRAVLELEALGAEVLVAAADVVDEEAMAQVVVAARERFGPIHGVLHAAGLPSGTMMQTKELAGVAATLAPKVRGTRVLESVLADETELELFFLFSSTGSVLGGLGYFDYCAANAFLDAFAAARHAAGRPVQAVNWGAFQQVGMAVASNLGFTSAEERDLFLSQAITPEEGVEAFQRVITRRIPRLVVWTQDLHRSLANSRLLSGAGGAEEEETQKARHPRPQLSTELVGPRDGEERELLAIWRDLTSIEDLGVRDDFFELGADSLLATQMLSRIRRQFGFSLSLDQLYQAPTVELLAEAVRAEAPAEEEAFDELAALLDEVEEMTEEELSESEVEEPTPGQ